MSVDMIIGKNELITYQLVGYQMDVKSAAAVAGVSGWKRSCCCCNESKNEDAAVSIISYLMSLLSSLAGCMAINLP